MSGGSQMTSRDHEHLRELCVQSHTGGGQPSTIMHRGRKFVLNMKSKKDYFCIKCIVLNCIFRYKGEVSSSKLQSSRLYQSAPDLMYSEYLEQGLSRSSRTMSLCNKYVESCSKYISIRSLLQKKFIRSKKKSCSNKFSGSKRLGCFVQRLPRRPGDRDERPRVWPRGAGHGDHPAAASDGQDHRAQGEGQQGQGQDQVSHQTMI